MEPRILLTGRQQSTLDVLVEELQRYGRDVAGTNDHARIAGLVREEAIDFVVIGGGLDDASRSEMDKFIKAICHGH